MLYLRNFTGDSNSFSFLYTLFVSIPLTLDGDAAWRHQFLNRWSWDERMKKTHKGFLIPLRLRYNMITFFSSPSFGYVMARELLCVNAAFSMELGSHTIFISTRIRTNERRCSFCEEGQVTSGEKVIQSVFSIVIMWKNMAHSWMRFGMRVVRIEKIHCHVNE